ncbi:hypothetical protein CQA49_00465 [Helicobacter sp. MIT 00-7814]|nr:hypothetical protein CQA49_00465 [Helicobacter sp. MIT 00-7814]RDU57723.1 hypothetical protein CQA37_00465 [Helicobacter sp. MIT 99-10781]
MKGNFEADSSILYKYRQRFERKIYCNVFRAILGSQKCQKCEILFKECLIPTQKAFRLHFSTKAIFDF